MPLTLSCYALLHRVESILNSLPEASIEPRLLLQFGLNNAWSGYVETLQSFEILALVNISEFVTRALIEGMVRILCILIHTRNWFRVSLVGIVFVVVSCLEASLNHLFDHKPGYCSLVKMESCHLTNTQASICTTYYWSKRTGNMIVQKNDYGSIWFAAHSGPRLV